jgi:hypothetical protein
MKSVRVYYAGIPKKNTKQEKYDVLRNFHLGVPNGLSTEVHEPIWQPSDLAVIQGWVHDSPQVSSHLKFRREVIQQQKLNNKRTIAIDSNLFLYQDLANKNQYLRFSLDGIFPTTGCYFTDRVDPGRWHKIKRDLGIELKPWRENGKYILICLQRNGGWSMKGLDVMQWCHRTINEIRKYTDRPIVVRAHPGDKKAREYLRLNLPGVKISKGKTLLDDFHKARAVVTYNSSPGVAAAIEGIPVFVTDPEPRNSQAYPVANTDLSLLLDPKRPDRQEWIERIAMSHFNFEDLRNGTAWNIIKDYI